MIVLDTAVLVYARGANHPLQEPSRGLIAATAEGRAEAPTTAEVIQEFGHVRARRRDRSEAVALGRDYADLLSPLLSIARDNLQHGGAAALLSADTAFEDLAEITHIVPDADGIAGLLRRG